MSQYVTVTRQDEVAVVTLDNPPVNALSFHLREPLYNALTELRDDASVAAIVIACAGRTFISGADITEFGTPKALQEPNLPMLCALLESMPKPAVAAIHGTALGGGLELALACDLRVAGTGAKVGLPEVSLGIYPAAGGTWRLPRLVGLGRAKDLVFTGRILGAEEAERIGLLERVVEDEKVLGTALELAQSIAANGPLAVQVAKLSLNAAARGADPATLEKLGQSLLFDSQDKQERMTAFLEKRTKKGQ